MLSLAAFAIRQGKALISKSYRCKYGCWTYYLPMLENFNIFFLCKLTLLHYHSPKTHFVKMSLCFVFSNKENTFHPPTAI